MLIYRSTGIVNFAQGEMAMFSTFIAWGSSQAGLPLWLALLGALAVLVRRRDADRARDHPAGRGPATRSTLVIVTLGLFILVNSLAGWIWGFDNRALPAPVRRTAARTSPASTCPYESLGIVAVLLVVVGLLYLLFQQHEARPGDARRGGRTRSRAGWSASASGAR